jgi:hypothetical protein
MTAATILPMRCARGSGFASVAPSRWWRTAPPIICARPVPRRPDRLRGLDVHDDLGLPARPRHARRQARSPARCARVAVQTSDTITSSGAALAPSAMWSRRVFPHHAWRPPTDVRFAPTSGGKADVPGGPSRATSRHRRSSIGRVQNGLRLGPGMMKAALDTRCDPHNDVRQS